MVDFPWELVSFPVRVLDENASGASAEIDVSGFKSIELIRASERGLGVTLWDDLPDQSYALHRTTQLVIALTGGCDLMLNDGVSWRDLNLIARWDEGQGRGILVKPNVWREFKAFSPGTVLMVLSDGVVGGDGEQKVRDWAQFMDRIGQPGKKKGRA